MIARSLRAAAMVALSLLPSCGGASGPVDGDRAYAHLEKIVAFGPRPFGSDALAKTADYVTGELTKLGLVPRRQEVVHEREQKTIRNLWVQIDGEDPQHGPILIVGSHYDTKLAAGHAEAEHNFPFVGAIDGGGGPAVLLELARVLVEQKQPRKVNVWLYWIDAEESLDWTWNNDRALLGSKAFCDMLAAEKLLPRVKAFVLLDLIGSKDFKIDLDGNSDERLQDLFLKAGKALGEDKRMYRYPTRAEIDAARQRGQKWGITDDHNTFMNRGVPSVLLIDFDRRMPGGREDPQFERWWHTPDDDLDAVDADALAFAGNLVVQALPDLEAFCLRK